MAVCSPNELHDCPVLDRNALVMTSGCCYSWHVCACSMPVSSQLYNNAKSSTCPLLPLSAAFV